MRKHEE
jgi:hypothetical protein